MPSRISGRPSAVNANGSVTKVPGEKLSRITISDIFGAGTERAFKGFVEIEGESHKGHTWLKLRDIFLPIDAVCIDGRRMQVWLQVDSVIEEMQLGNLDMYAKERRISRDLCGFWKRDVVWAMVEPFLSGQTLVFSMEREAGGVDEVRLTEYGTFSLA